MKTHKCVEAARFQIRGHFGGITVSTLAEARFFAAARVPGHHLRRAHRRLPPRGGGRDRPFPRRPSSPSRSRVHPRGHVRLRPGEGSAPVLVPEGRLRLPSRGSRSRKRGSVALALRMARSRGGRFPRDPDPRRDTRTIRPVPKEIKAVAETERSVMDGSRESWSARARRLRKSASGPPLPFLSADSLRESRKRGPETTCSTIASRRRSGSCGIENAAFTVLASVLSHYPERNEILIDAGGLALSRDEGPTHLDADCGYGEVFSADGTTHFASLRVRSISQEHGKIQGPGPDRLRRIARGLQAPHRTQPLLPVRCPLRPLPCVSRRGRGGRVEARPGLVKSGWQRMICLPHGEFRSGRGGLAADGQTEPRPLPPGATARTRGDGRGLPRA